MEYAMIATFILLEDAAEYSEQHGGGCLIMQLSNGLYGVYEITKKF